MQGLEAGRAFIKAMLDDKDVQKGLERLEGRLQSSGKSMMKIGGAIGATGLAIGAAFLGPIEAASNLQETMNKFDIVFGENAAAVKAWGDEYAAQVGRSKQQIAEFMGNTQDLLVPIGIDPKTATETSKQLTMLASDLASFNNMEDADVLRDLHAALTGSGEVMKKYGVIVSETAVKQQLLKEGLDPKEATEAQKVFARMTLIMAGTTAAQGDAIRSAGAYANQTKALWGTLNDLQAVIGNAVLPMVTQVIGVVREAAVAGLEWATNNQDLVAGIGVAAGVITALGATVLAAGVAVQAVSVAVGLWTTALTVASTIMGVLSAATTVCTTVMGAFAAVAAVIGAPVWLVAAAITAVVGVLGYLAVKLGVFDLLGDALSWIGGILKSVFGPVVTWAIDKIKWLLSWLGKAASGIASTFSGDNMDKLNAAAAAQQATGTPPPGGGFGAKGQAAAAATAPPPAMPPEAIANMEAINKAAADAAVQAQAAAAEAAKATAVAAQANLEAAAKAAGVGPDAGAAARRQQDAGGDDPFSERTAVATEATVELLKTISAKGPAVLTTGV